MAAINYNTMPGPGDLPGDRNHPNSPEYDDSRNVEIERLVAIYRNDPAKLREAEGWTAGSFDGTHYTAVSLALDALHFVGPDKLLDSDVLATLYRLAEVNHLAIESKLREMAEDEIAGRDNVMGTSAAWFLRIADRMERVA